MVECKYRLIQGDKMKKKKVPKTNAMRMLEQMKIPYAVHEYEWSDEHLDARHVLRAMRAEVGAVYKTIVTVGDKNGVNVAVLPAERELDLKALARISGNKRIELLELDKLEETTGYIRGGCSPIGMKRKFPTYLAEEATKEEKILVSAGKRGLQVELAPEELIRAASAVVAAFTTGEI